MRALGNRTSRRGTCYRSKSDDSFEDRDLTVVQKTHLCCPRHAANLAVEDMWHERRMNFRLLRLLAAFACSLYVWFM